MKVIPTVLLCTSVGMSMLAQADVFDVPTEATQRAEYFDKDGGARDARIEYLTAKRDGTKPSPESIFEYEIKPWMVENKGATLMREDPYYKKVLPYFSGGHHVSTFDWNEESIRLVKERRSDCDSAILNFQIANRDAYLASRTTVIVGKGMHQKKMGDEEQKSFQNHMAQAVEIKCMGVMPYPKTVRNKEGVGPLSFVWTALQAHQAKSKNENEKGLFE